MKKLALIMMMMFAVSMLVSADEFDDKVKMILKVLNYDRSIGSRTSEGVRISIVYNNTSSKSTQEAVAMSGAFAKVKGQSVQNNPVNNSIDLFAADLRDKLKGYTALYVCSDVDIKEVIRVSSDVKVLSIGADNKYSKKVSVRLVNDSGTIKIYLKEDQIQKEGANLAAELKSIAVIE